MEACDAVDCWCGTVPETFHFRTEGHAAVLAVEVPRVGLPKFKEEYTLPQIKNGNTADAFETLATGPRGL